METTKPKVINHYFIKEDDKFINEVTVEVFPGIAENKQQPRIKPRRTIRDLYKELGLEYLGPNKK